MLFFKKMKIDLILFLMFFLLNSFILNADPNFIFVEGEDAIVTNFNNEPTFNFKCSNSMALQLNKKVDLEGELKYFADYVINVETDGDYILWLAGTPPGPATPGAPSYFSPMQIKIDEKEPVSLFLEDVQVVEKYNSSFYWVKISKVKLTKGKHKIKFIVQKRREDQYFYFYIDAFFLIKTTQWNDYVYPKELPAFFPKEINSKNNIQFKSYYDYEYFLKLDQDNKEYLERISEVYMLLREHDKAIKYLKNLLILSNDSIDVKRLIAQNYLWKGDFTSGMNIFKEILKKNPDDLSLSKEVCKITAWSGVYYEAIKLYKDAIKKFPDDIELQVDLALAYFWNAEEDNGKAILESLKRKGKKNPDILLQAGMILQKNRYFEEAITFYNLAISNSIKNPLAYTNLALLQLNKGLDDMSKKTLENMKKIFESDEEYNNALNIFYNKLSLRDELIKENEEKLKINPDDLETRLILAQTYSWQHLDKKAIEQYLRILETRTFLQIEQAEKNNLSLIDYNITYNLYLFALNEKEKTGNLIKEIERDLANLKKLTGKDLTEDAKKQFRDLEKKIIIAEQKLELFNSLISKYEEKDLKLNDLLTGIKNDDSYKLLKGEIDKLKWTWNITDFKSIFTSMLRDYNSYLSLKILGLSNYFLNNFEYRDYFNKMYTNFPQFEKTKYSYLILLSENNNYPELSKFLDENIFNLTKIDTNLQDYKDELNAVLMTDKFDENKLSLMDPDIQSLENRFSNIQKNYNENINIINEKMPRIKKSIIDIKSSLQYQLTLMMFKSEKDLVGLRIELADYYIKNRNYKNAQTELDRIVKVDPENLTVKYQLANMYQLRENWFKAMQLYKEVYEKDPRNTLAASLYNEISDQHPMTFESNTKFSTEGALKNNITSNVYDFTQSLIYITENIRSELYFTRFFSVDFGLFFQNYTRKEPIGFLYEDVLNEINYANSFDIKLRYNEYLLYSTLIFDIPYTGLKLSGRAGFDIFNAFTVETQSTEFITGYDALVQDKIDDFYNTKEQQNNYLDKVVLYPYFKFGLKWNLIPYFDFLFEYYYYLNSDSVLPYINGYYFHHDIYLANKKNNQSTYLSEHTFNLSLNYNLSFIKFYPFTNITFSSVGEVELFHLSDISQTSNILPFHYTLTQNTYFKFLDLKKIGLFMTLLNVVSYEGSHKDFDQDITVVSEIDEQDYLYDTEDYFLMIYSPHQILNVKGGLKIEFDFGYLTPVPLAIYVQGSFGAYWKHIFNVIKNETTWDPKNYNNKNAYIIFNVVAGIELSLKKFSLDLLFEYDLKYDTELPHTVDADHFQSINCSLFIKVPISKNITY